MAVKATLHCLVGCNTGEAVGAGLIGGLIFSVGTNLSIILGIIFAFIFGYLFTVIPLYKEQGFKNAIKIAIKGDTGSIVTMEAVENIVVFALPGFVTATIFDPIFWIGWPIILGVGFAAAYPVLYYIIKKGKGHH